MSNTEPFDEDLPDDAVEEAGWDAFWSETLRAEQAEHGRAPTEVIRGVTVRVPQDVPLRYQAKADQLKASGEDSAFAELLAELFGVDVLDAWTAAGMGGRELRVVLAWGLSHGKGKPISFREAYDLVHSNDVDDAEGKASPPKTGGSGGSGRSSKQTSPASTGTGRKTSRR